MAASIAGPFVIGIDVGSYSVRGGLFSLSSNNFLRSAIRRISVHKVRLPLKDGQREVEGVTQSSTEIWKATIEIVREIAFDIDPKLIKGIGFDATCSLVVLGKSGEPLQVGRQNACGEGEYVQNVVMWMDHRGSPLLNSDEAAILNEKLKDHKCLSFIGGKLSPEMQIPKILWLKNHMPEIYQQAGKFLDLVDFMTWKCTSNDTRSMCAVVCKGLYQVDINDPHKHGWDYAMFSSIGLEDLTADRIGAQILPPGTPLASGLNSQAAAELGLLEGTAVATGLIDAHGGALALAFCQNPETAVDPHSRLAMICGTSTCYLTASKDPVFVPGVWGPYYSAVLPGSWTNEGGQSVSGEFLDHIIQSHPFYLKTLRPIYHEHLRDTYKFLNRKALSEAERLGCDVSQLSGGLHVFPDFHGNRSPLSNPNITGMITGLTLDGGSEMSLVRLYIAALQGLCYESRWIIETMIEKGIKVADVAACGGLSHNRLFVQMLADVLQRPVLLPDITESMILGASMLAATASGHYGSLLDAGANMGGSGRAVPPKAATAEHHNERYKVFLKMAAFQQDLARLSGKT